VQVFVLTLEPELRVGAQALGLALSDQQVAQLLAYLALIAKWNKVYNLTAVRDERQMLSHHLLDSLAVVEPLRRQQGGAGRLLDVGSGAGLPGVVLAICCPQLKVDCLDAVAKKAAFVQQAGVTLALPNLRGLHGRIETICEAYEVVSSRAFASLADFVAGSRQALAEQGIWLAMKGKHPADEMASLPADVAVFHVEQLAVPGLEAERCIVWMRKAAASLT
jgi:16S rRNA (guanine527-N7)-methyltransferase